MEIVCVGHSMATIAADGRIADRSGTAAVAFSNSRLFIGNSPIVFRVVICRCL
jgi:hypothetical protein